MSIEAHWQYIKHLSWISDKNLWWIITLVQCWSAFSQECWFPQLLHMQCVTFVKTALLRVIFADTLDRIIIMWIPQNSLDDKSTVVHVIVWPLPEPLFTKTSAAIRRHWVKIQPIMSFQKCISVIVNYHRWMVLGRGHPKTSIMLHNLTLFKKNIYI